MGMHIGAKAQIIDPNGQSMFGFSEISNYGNSAQRAIIYSTKPRTVTFKIMALNFNGSSNVIGYFKAGSSFTDTTGDWLFSTNTNGVTYKTVQLVSGRNYIELGLRVYFAYSSPALIMFIDSYSPLTEPGEGISGSVNGMNTALSVSIY